MDIWDFDIYDLEELRKIRRCYDILNNFGLEENADRMFELNAEIEKKELEE